MLVRRESKTQILQLGGNDGRVAPVVPNPLSVPHKCLTPLMARISLAGKA